MAVLPLGRSPLNRLEVAVAEAKAGRIPVSAMLRVLFASDLVVPSAAPVDADGAGLRPVMFPRADHSAVACFTAFERVRDVEEIAPYALLTPSRAWLPRVADGHGLAVNPGQAIGFEIDPDGLRRAVADFAR